MLFSCAASVAHFLFLPSYVKKPPSPKKFPVKAAFVFCYRMISIIANVSTASIPKLKSEKSRIYFPVFLG